MSDCRTLSCEVQGTGVETSDNAMTSVFVHELFKARIGIDDSVSDLVEDARVELGWRSLASMARRGMSTVSPPKDEERGRAEALSSTLIS